MPNKNYVKGYRFERRVKKFYEKNGYYVIRSYASKGPADLYAFKPCRHCGNCLSSELLLIQCKNYDITKRRLTGLERYNLDRLASETGGFPILVGNINHKMHIQKL